MANRSPTLDEVAAAAGVSRMTASRALNGRPGVSDRVRDDIVRIAKEIGYEVNRAAQKLASRRKQIIGLVTAQMHAPFTTEFVAGAVRATRTAGYETLVYSLLEPGEGLPASVSELLGRIAQGVIAILPQKDDYFAALAAANVPVITIEGTTLSSTCTTIVCDNYNGARAAVRHLVDLGHERIAHVRGEEHLASTPARLRGYEDVLREAGLPRDRSLLVPGDGTQACGFLATRRLLALPRPPTAIFTFNDATAIGALEGAHAMGLRVPEDLSVVGFDDVPGAAQTFPPLTTVRQPIEQMGRSAVNTLLAVVAGIEAVAPIITFPTELVVRASTAPPSKGKPRRRLGRHAP